VQGHAGSVQSVAVLDDLLVSGSWDKTVRVWDSKTGTCLQTLEGHTGYIWDVEVRSSLIPAAGVSHFH